MAKSTSKRALSTSGPEAETEDRPTVEETEDRPKVELHWSLGSIAVVWTVFQLFIEFRPGVLQTYQTRVIHLTLAIATLLCLDMVRNSQARRPLRALVSAVLLLAWIVVAVGTYLNLQRLHVFIGAYSHSDVIWAALGLALVAEFSRRRLGWALPIIGILFLLYGIFGSSAPGTLRLPTLQWDLVLNSAYYTDDGVFGSILGAAVTYIFLFVIFGSLLLQYGFGEYLTRLARLVFGNSVGSAAKMSLLAGMLFGSVSDSTTANVSTTGSVTIPYMKRSGFSKAQAAGIEAGGSVGGQISPPVMGATAFVMSAITGIPYSTIILAALLPALLFYVGLFLVVHGDSARLRVGSLGRLGSGEGRQLLRDGWRFAVPMGVLVYLLLIRGLVPSTAAAWSIIVLVACNVWGHSPRRSLADLYVALTRGCRNMVVVSLATAVVGMIVAPVATSGIGLKIGSLLVQASGGSLIVLLLLGTLGILVMGSGLPTTATYIIMSILIVPSLTNFGLPVLSAHLFVLYFAVLSDITPPTMATVYVAAGLAEARPIYAAGHTMRVAAAGFLIPFIWIYQPSLLIPQSAGAWQLLLAAFCGLGATVALSVLISRFWFAPVRWQVLIATIVGGVAMVTPYTAVRIAGGILLIGVTGYQLIQRFVHHQHNSEVVPAKGSGPSPAGLPT